MTANKETLHVTLAPITVGGSPLPPKCVALETPEEPWWRETWFWEQFVYALLFLGPAMAASYLALAAKGAVGVRDVVLLVLAALSQFIAQKARSVATRQTALTARMKYPLREVRCAPKVKRWTQAGQVLGAFLAVATAPTWWHLPSIIWALFAYDLWRSHRETRKNQVLIGGF
jgi:hypothetical protein